MAYNNETGQWEQDSQTDPYRYPWPDGSTTPYIPFINPWPDQPAADAAPATPTAPAAPAPAAPSGPTKEQLDAIAAQSGSTYDPSDWQATMDGRLSLEEFTRRQQARGGSTGTPFNELSGTPSGGTVSNWAGQSTQGSNITPVSTQIQFPDWYKTILEQQMASQQALAGQNQSRNNALYDTLMGRAGQGLDIDRNDPIIRQQADAYAANEERARRNYLGDIAEGAGPYANMRGEQRMSAERMGQRTGSFEAELVGRELTARREEIAQALESMQGLLTVDQQQNLTRQLAMLDQAIKEQQLGISNKGVDNDLTAALMRNAQFYSGLNSQNDQFAAQFGLDTTQQANYWDSLRRGLL